MDKKSKNIILEHIFNNLLLEAKSPEEVLNILSKKYNGVVAPSIIKKFMDLDPTKKFSYTRWVLNVLVKHNSQDGIDWVGVKSLFDCAYQNNDFELQTFETFGDALRGMKIYKGRKEYEVIYEDEKWIIYVPHSYYAERYIVHHLYGGATWCTASSSGDYYFKEYNQNGDKLYIFANKETNDIYQFSPRSGEFNDSQNVQVDYPAQLVGGTIYDWFKDQGMDLDSGSFPGPDDIYDGGDYGLKCINDLYMKYVLCDSRGRELCSTIYWSPTEIEEYEGAIIIHTMEYRKHEMHVVSKGSNDTYYTIAEFDEENGEPIILNNEYIIGLYDERFSFVSLKDGIELFYLDDCDEFEKIGKWVILRYDGDYVLFSFADQALCGDKQGFRVSWYYTPEYNKEDGLWYGELEDGTELIYNPETKEVKKSDDGGGSDDMIESIKKQFNTILEGLNKNY